MSAPAFVAIWPADNFVIIPPEAKVEFALPPIAKISSVISLISGTCLAFTLREGSAVYNPSISDNKISRSAEIIPATRAASLSLSPNLISYVVTVSFSFTTGITSRFKSVFIVALAFK